MDPPLTIGRIKPRKAATDTMVRNLLKLVINWMTRADLGMRFESVFSRSIVEVGYDASSRTLGVVYDNGLVYVAHDFPESEYQKLILTEDFDRAFPKVVLSKFDLIKRARWAPFFPKSSGAAVKGS